MFSLFGFVSLHLLIGEKMRKVVFLRTLLGSVSTHIGGEKVCFDDCVAKTTLKYE